MILGVVHDPNDRKFELFQLVQLHKPPSDEKNYKIDNLITSYGHTPLRTPPYMCELNPIELAWARIKYLIRSSNTTGELSITRLKDVTNEAIASVTGDEWKKFCQHVIGIEDMYWETDRLIEEIEPIIINVSPNDSDTDDTDDDYSESEPE